MGSVASTVSRPPAGNCASRFSIFSTGSGHLSPRASRTSSAKDEDPVDAVGRVGIVDRGDTGSGGGAVDQGGGIGRRIAPAREGFGEGEIAGGVADLRRAGGLGRLLAGRGIFGRQRLRGGVEGCVLG